MVRQYIDRQTASEEFGLSIKTIGKIFEEIDVYVGKGKRYGSYSFRGEEKTRQVRYAVMDDYMRWRTWLKDPDRVKHVPPFSVRDAEKELGVTSREAAIDIDRIAEDVFRKLLERLGGAAGNATRPPQATA
ncbi:MAG: hypothetical protein Q4A32_00805 [Lachnospiraceae bacterium]|nr:hypothetical protein [Lachnospiraceae bacterium]